MNTVENLAQGLVTMEITTNGDFKNFLDAFSGNPEFSRESLMELHDDTDADTVMRILARFHETLTQSSAGIRASRATGDAETIWRAAHKLAGSAELLGFKSFGNLAREFSHQVRANPDVSCNEPDVGNFLELVEGLIGKIAAGCPNLSTYLV